jgi:uncharacterized membrane protein
MQCNEEADKLAKQGAEKPQTNNNVSLPEINIMIKSIYRTPCSSNNYHQWSRQEQVIILCLRTGHNRLNAHMNTSSLLHPPAVPVERLTRQLNTCSRSVKTTGRLGRDSGRYN